MPMTVAVGIALGLYTFQDTLIPLTCGSHTVKYAKITALMLKHTTPMLNHNLRTVSVGMHAKKGERACTVSACVADRRRVEGSFQPFSPAAEDEETRRQRKLSTTRRRPTLRRGTADCRSPTSKYTMFQPLLPPLPLLPIDTLVLHQHSQEVRATHHRRAYHHPEQGVQLV